VETAIGLLILGVLVGAPFLAIFLWIKLAKVRKKVLEHSEANQRLGNELAMTDEKLSKAHDEIKFLEPFKEIANLDKETKKIKKEADDYSDAVTSKADDYATKRTEEVNNEAKSVLAAAKEKAQVASQKAELKFNEAMESSRKIVENAKLRAEEIAGDALKAKMNSDHFEKTAQAMKNKINGYKDEYIIPNQTLLDELAEDFAHKEAGLKLKQARLHTKKLISTGLAAACDYVESHRKSIAISFVVDAFNGKVDTILTKVKHDNYGKLKQEIEDAFTLVNYNGKAFRNARIKSEYLAARLDELKWAVSTNELKLQEREEQRQIKEAMREEAKARKEYEKTIREAEKEEKMLQKAKAKIEKQLQEASEEERQKLQQQILELQEKLTEVEEKNQRAQSMAQMTRQGHVYVISNIGSFGEDVFKIGLTRRLEPEIRVKELGDASVPFPFDIHAMLHSDDAPALETQLHHIFHDDQVNKVNHRKEFFRTGIGQIRKTIDSLGIEAHWTLAAEAKEYRESLALESASSGEKDNLRQEEMETAVLQ
jgi:hypothetical protein